MIEIINGTSHQINLFLPLDTISIQDGRKLILKPLGIDEDDIEDLLHAYEHIELDPDSSMCWEIAIQKICKHGYPKPIKVIPPGTNLDAVKKNLPAPELDVDFLLKGGVVFESHDPIPDGDIVVVSQIFRSAVKELGGNTSRLATVDGTVYKSPLDLRPCGCTALAVG
jgi:hypothetical protein